MPTNRISNDTSSLHGDGSSATFCCRDSSFITFREALSDFILNREAILSPSTIKEYSRLAAKNFDEINEIPVDQISQADIQRFVNNACARGLSSKSVHNIHALISAVLNNVRPDLKLNTTLPRKAKPNLYIPSDDEVVKLITYIRARGSRDMLVSILLAAYGPMRRSEICGLYDEDVNGNVIHVHRAMVYDRNNHWILKNQTKTAASNRFISMPDFVIDEIKDIKGKLVNLNPDCISTRFSYTLKNAGIPHFRFHDLRHYSASIQHAIGIPDAYIMARGGWESDTTLKNIYRHALDAEAKKANDKINDYFTSLQK